MVITGRLVQRAYNLTRGGMSDGRAVSMALSEKRARFTDPGEIAEVTIALGQALALYRSRVISPPERRKSPTDRWDFPPVARPTLPPELERSLSFRAQTKATVTTLLSRQTQQRTFTPRITAPACTCGHLATVHQLTDDGSRGACQFGGDDSDGTWACHCSRQSLPA